MNEHRLAKSICLHLDVGAERVPFRVQQRLEAARRSALDRLPTDTAGARALSAGGPNRRSPDQRSQSPGPDAPTPLWWRVTATALPALLVVAGLVVGDALQQEQAIEDLAEVDSALLTDEVPLVAYADHGFGVYLMNTRR